MPKNVNNLPTSLFKIILLLQKVL